VRDREPVDEIVRLLSLRQLPNWHHRRRDPGRLGREGRVPGCLVRTFDIVEEVLMVGPPQHE